MFGYAKINTNLILCKQQGAVKRSSQFSDSIQTLHGDCSITGCKSQKCKRSVCQRNRSKAELKLFCILDCTVYYEKFRILFSSC